MTPTSLLSDHVEVLIKEVSAQARGKGPKQRIRVRDKWQAAADRVKNKQNGNDEEYSGGEEEDAVSASSGKRGCSSGSGSNSDKVGSKRSRAIAESRRGESSSDRKIGLSRTVAAGPFRCRDEGDGQEGESKLHIPRLLGR